MFFPSSRAFSTYRASLSFWIVLLFVLLGAHLTTAAPSAATLRMVQRLRVLDRESDPMVNSYLNDRRVTLFARQLIHIHDPRRLVRVLPYYADQLLFAGHSEEAITEYERLKTLAARVDPNFLQQNLETLTFSLALAHLRVGEQENCISNHTPDSCLLPLQGGGIYRFQRGSRGAITVLEQGLARFPNDLNLRWLLNIAYMTLGEYPQHVPARWLIPPAVFRSGYDIHRFLDVARTAGVDVPDHAGGSVAEDFDGDGLIDLMVSSFHLRDQIHFFHNNGDGTFSDRTQIAGLTGITGGLNMVHADYNNDGYPDVLVLRGAWRATAGHYPNSLLRNNGDGTFDDVTEQAGLLSFHPTQTAVWFDYNNDGWLDLFIGNETWHKDRNPCQLYRNNGDGTFTECAAQNHLDVTGFVKAVASADFNHDGRPDLYISRLGQPNLLFRNDGPVNPHGSANGPWRFTDVTRRAGVAEPIYSFPIWFFDYDNDGWPDLFVCGYHSTGVSATAADYLGLPTHSETPRLYHNNHDGTFTDVTRKTHLNHVLDTMGCGVGDLDNDGYLDFYLGTGSPDFSIIIPNRMFRNASGKYFQDVTSSGDFGNIQKGHAVSFADFDNDGDQDVYEVLGGGYTGDAYWNVLFENPGHGHHWIKLILQGVRSNRCAIGTRLHLTVTDGAASRSLYRTVTSGTSFGDSPFRQEIGLGNASAIQRLEVYWPASGKTQVFTHLALDRCYRIREDSPEPKLVSLRTFHFRHPALPSGALPQSSSAP